VGRGVAARQLAKEVGVEEVERAVVRTGGAAAVRMGQAGATAVRAVYEIGPQTRILINGRNRIPDGMTEKVLSEVKNTKSLSYTQQLRDFADFARQKSLDFHLYVRQGTKLSGPLKREVESGNIVLRYIP